MKQKVSVSENEIILENYPEPKNTGDSHGCIQDMDYTCPGVLLGLRTKGSGLLRSGPKPSHQI